MVRSNRIHDQSGRLHTTQAQHTVTVTGMVKSLAVASAAVGDLAAGDEFE